MKRTLIISLLLLFWAVILLSGLGAYVVGQNSARLARDISVRITNQLDGASVSMEGVGLQIFPRPALELKEVVIRTTDGLSFFAASCAASPRWLSLLTGGIHLSSLTLDDPVLIYELNDPTGTTRNGDAFDPSSLVFVSGLKLTLRNGQIQILHSDEAQKRPLCTFTGLNGSLRLPELNGSSSLEESGAGELDLRAESVSLYDPKTDQKASSAPSFTLSRPALQLENVRIMPGDHPQFQGKALLSGDMPFSSSQKSQGRFACTANMMQKDASLFLDGEFSLKDPLILNGQAIPTRVRIPFSVETTLPALPEYVRISNARFILAEDEASFNGKVDLAVQDSGISPSLTGRLDVTRFSLPRWFDFARALPAGLQHALDSLSGTLELALTTKSLRISDARIHLLDMPFSGSGSMDSFASPVIQVDLKTESLRADKLFPELNGASVKNPYETPPLFSSTTPQEPPSEDTPGYAVRLQARNASFRSIAGKDLTLNISPEADTPRLSLEVGSLYGGRFSGSLIPGDVIKMTMNFAGLNVEPLLVSLGQPSVWKGRLTAAASLSADGSNASRFLSSVKGSMTARLDNGSLMLADKGARQSFKKLGFSFQGRGQKGNVPTAFVCVGKWTGEVDQENTHLTANIEGPVRFTWGPQGMHASGADLKSSLSAGQKGLAGTLSGILGFDTDKGMLEINGIQGRSDGADLTGTIKGSDLRHAARWEGNLTLVNGNLRRVLAACDALPDGLPSSALRNLSASARFSMNGDTLEIREVRGKLDQTLFSGQLGKKNGPDRPQWSFNLDLETLNVDTYLPQGSSPKTSSPWPAEKLNIVDAQGKLTAKKLIIAQIPHERLVIPVLLKNGVLTADPITASVTGGRAGAGFRAEATSDGALVRLHYTLADCDMYRLSLARHQADLIAGTGNFDADASGRVRSSADIPGALNGTWKFAITNGGLGKSFRFSHLGASGKLASGVLSSRDMALRGSSFNVKGYGWINLVKKTLDYNLTVSGSGLPDIPVRYYGSLSNPRRSISASSIIMGTLSGLFNGTLNVLDTIIAAPLRYLGPSARL